MFKLSFYVFFICFIEEKVDGETFQDITDADLKEIGVKLGTRKKIMKIIHNFKVSTHHDLKKKKN